MLKTKPCSKVKCDPVKKTNIPETDLMHRIKDISDTDLEKLRQHIRVLKGLTLTEEKTRKKIDFTSPPIISPRLNAAATLRASIHRRWIEINLPSIMKKYSLTEEKVDEELTDFLRKEALSRSYCDYIEEKENEYQENLKKLSQLAKSNEDPHFRANKNFDLRLKTAKGLPIITEDFRRAYENFEKTPFHFSKKCELKSRQLQPIDEENEMWLYPFIEDEPIPLHRQQKPQPVDTRSAKEKTRPPVKPGKYTPLAERRSVKVPPTKKPPWRFVSSCSSFL